MNDQAIPLDDDQPIEAGTDHLIEIDESAPASGETKIQTFGSKTHHADKWHRTPNVTGTGAIHCKVFHCKLREDALEYLEKQVNQWLDEHPEYEVKFVTTSVGQLKTKTMTEDALFMTLWV